MELDQTPFSDLTFMNAKKVADGEAKGFNYPILTHYGKVLNTEFHEEYYHQRWYSPNIIRSMDGQSIVYEPYIYPQINMTLGVFPTDYELARNPLFHYDTLIDLINAYRQQLENTSRAYRDPLTPYGPFIDQPCLQWNATDIDYNAKINYSYMLPQTYNKYLNNIIKNTWEMFTQTPYPGYVDENMRQAYKIFYYGINKRIALLGITSTKDMDYKKLLAPLTVEEAREIYWEWNLWYNNWVQYEAQWINKVRNDPTDINMDNYNRLANKHYAREVRKNVLSYERDIDIAIDITMAKPTIVPSKTQHSQPVYEEVQII